MSSQAPQVSEQVQSRYQLTPSTLPRTTAGLYDGRDAAGAAVLVRALADDAFASAAERQRARREILKLVQVRHVALATVLESGEEGAVTWYARERVPGETLTARIARKGSLSPGEAAWVAMKLAGALAELHRHGIQHRDLRPDRVILTPDGGVKLLDAAVGRVFRLADGRVIPGSPGYVAPEAITGRLVSFRSDLYALGTVLYECLAGRATFPVAEPSRRLQLQVESDPDALPGALPEGLVRFTFSLLSREQRDRPFSAQQVERQLEPFAVAPELEAPADAGVDDGERTMAFESPIEGHRPSPLGSTPYDDRADDAPTRLSLGLHEPGGRTLAGMDAAPVAAAPAATASSAPGALGVRLPKMPTLPPIPSSAMRMSTPGIAPSPSGAPPAAAAPPPAAAAPPRRQTMMGMPMSGTQGGSLAPAAAVQSVAPAAAPAPLPSAPPAKASSGPGLDYDDLGDTTVNDDSQAFGLPGYPLPAAGTPAVAAAPRGATAVGYAVPNGGAFAPTPLGATMLGVGGYGAPAAVSAPPMGASVPPAVQAPPPREAPGVQPNLPPVFGQQPVPYQEYPAAPPRKESNLGVWIAAAVAVVLIAGVGGLAAAKLTGGGGHDDSPAEVTVVPPQTAAPPVDPAATPPPPATEQAVEQTVVMPSTPVAEPPPAAPPPAAPAAPPQPAARPQPAAPVVRPQPTAPAVRPQPSAPVARPQPAAPAARLQPTTPVARPQPAAPPPAVRPAPAPAPATGPVAAGDPRIAEALRTRNYPQARTLLQGALRTQPNNAGLHAQLGNVFERLGDRAAALNEYRTATRLDRRNTSYLHRLADLQVATGDRTGAQATLRQILTITPNDRGAQARLQALGG